MFVFRSGNSTTPILVAVIAVLSGAMIYVLFANRANTDVAAQDIAQAASATPASNAKTRVPAGEDCPLCATIGQPSRYARTTGAYAIPAIMLVDADGNKVALRDELEHDGPVMMQFVFTTCPTICPVMSATFASAQQQLGPEKVNNVRMVSISIDPEHDTPARLKQYARNFNAGPQWHFLTGTRRNIAAVQKAFDAFQDNKMRHAPLTFVRASGNQPWLRIEGLLSATELLAELDRKPQPDARPPSDQPLAELGDSSTTSDVELGKRIYHDGILPSSAPLRAMTLGDVEVEGSHVNCASCHRGSGFAGGEETVYVPPITGPVLFHERQLNRGELFRQLFQDVQAKATTARVHDGRYRPAYTDETLAAAIRHGTDPTGRQLDMLMPRYQLSDEDVGHLVAYLKSLFSKPTPGVDESTIHFATVVCEGVPDAQRRAMLEVLEAYVRRKNSDTQGKLQHPGFSPLYKDEFKGSFRQWELHVWQLHGPPETWDDQLYSYYQTQPVFALLSGISADSWSPVHDFCERTELPCLFPHVDLPVVTADDAYTLYFSKGLTVEAEALARHLRDDVSSANSERIVQVVRDIDRGRVPAAALRRALQDSAMPSVKDHVISGDQELTPDFWKALVEDEQPSVLVLWLEDSDLDVLATPALDDVPQVYLSHSLLQSIPAVESAELRDKIHLTHQFTLPGSEVPRIYRVRAWMRSRRIELTHEPIQLNTFFALSITDHALVHLVENFSRDYLIESIEHETENSLNPGIFPHLSLGPGQRYASKGSYIVGLPAEPGGELRAVSDWIVP